MSLARRKGPDRRVRHAMPLPPRGGGPVDPATVEGPSVAFGPQAELCRNTACCACFSVWWRRCRGSERIDWTQLPGIVGGTRSDAHHEPPRGHACASDDDDCIPLCRMHHTDGFWTRHRKGEKAFYEYFGFDWTAVRDEMRARVAGKAKPSPVVVEDVPPSTWLPPETDRTRP